MRPSAIGGPEDWLGSLTRVSGEASLGLSRDSNGRLLVDLIALDPTAYFGPCPTAATTGLLVKLLDAGERLPIHLHPDRSYARRFLGDSHGKTEAWCVLRTQSELGEVFLGWSRDVGREEVDHWVATQDVEAMIASMNRLEVRRGDVVYVPAGTAHSIGPGVLVLELQEPTDYSILLEWKGFAIDGETDGHLGLGFPKALEALTRSRLSPRELKRLVRSVYTSSPLPDDADHFFQLNRLTAADQPLPPRFRIGLVAEGSGDLITGAGRLSIECGETYLFPYASGSLEVTGDAELLLCAPPRT